MRNKWLWLLGGGAAVLWWIKAGKAEAQRPGELAIHYSTETPGRAGVVLTAILSGANAACPGLPQIIGLNRGPFVAGGGAGPTTSLSVTIIVNADWTHDTLGPLKPEVVNCLLRYLKSIDPDIGGVSAKRLT
jgi:hypothetical protein